MFSRNWFVLILFFGELLSFDNRSEKQLKKGFTVNPLAKKAISFGVGVVVAVASQKAIFLKIVPSDNKFVPDFSGFIADKLDGSLVLGCCLANFKLIPLFVVGANIISLDNGNKLCNLINVVYGCCAGAICYYGLKKFFPN